MILIIVKAPPTLIWTVLCSTSGLPINYYDYSHNNKTKVVSVVQYSPLLLTVATRDSIILWLVHQSDTLWVKTLISTTISARGGKTKHILLWNSPPFRSKTLLMITFDVFFFRRTRSPRPNLQITAPNNSHQRIQYIISVPIINFQVFLRKYSRSRRSSCFSWSILTQTTSTVLKALLDHSLSSIIELLVPIILRFSRSRLNSYLLNTADFYRGLISWFFIFKINYWD